MILPQMNHRALASPLTHSLPSLHRSTLHADPFSWHGYNYLLEGSKVWTFLPPQSSEALEAYTLEPNAWGDGDESMSIAVGQESPIDLYWDILVDEEELGRGCTAFPLSKTSPISAHRQTADAPLVMSFRESRGGGGRAPKRSWPCVWTEP